MEVNDLKSTVPIEYTNDSNYHETGGDPLGFGALKFVKLGWVRSDNVDVSAAKAITDNYDVSNTWTSLSYQGGTDSATDVSASSKLFNDNRAHIKIVDSSGNLLQKGSTKKIIGWRQYRAPTHNDVEDEQHYSHIQAEGFLIAKMWHRYTSGVLDINGENTDAMGDDIIVSTGNQFVSDLCGNFSFNEIDLSANRGISGDAYDGQKSGTNNVARPSDVCGNDNFVMVVTRGNLLPEGASNGAGQR